MKKTILAALLSCFVLPNLAAGQARTKPTSLQRARDTFRAADRDSSKGLGFQELQIAGLSRKEFDRYDEGRDGQWTQDEFLLYYSQLLSRSGREPAQDLLDEVSLVKERMKARRADKKPVEDARDPETPEPQSAAEKLKAKLKPSRSVAQPEPEHPSPRAKLPTVKRSEVPTPAEHAGAPGRREPRNLVERARDAQRAREDATRNAANNELRGDAADSKRSGAATRQAERMARKRREAEGAETTPQTPEKPGGEPQQPTPSPEEARGDANEPEDTGSRGGN